MSSDTYQALEEAIANHIAQNGGGYLGSWLVVAETLDPQAKDENSWFTEASGSAITTRGLIEYARDTHKYTPHD